MKSLLVGAALLVLPGAAWAQGCFVSSGCNTTIGGGAGTWSCTYAPCGTRCCDEGNSFSTKHTWKVTKPGTLTLSGTGFTVVFEDADFLYHLKWRDKDLSASDGMLSVVERRGVALATDRQEAGLPLE